jgi:hypothetical protein
MARGKGYDETVFVLGVVLWHLGVARHVGTY